MKVRAIIRLKSGVLDPQGKAIETALHSLGFEDAANVRQGKVIEFDVEASDQAAAKTQAEAMCAKLLANPVMETYTVEFPD